MYRLLRPLLFQLDAERAHGLGLRAAQLAQRWGGRAVERLFGYEHAALRQSLWGLPFENPVGLAAGFDKNARLAPFWKQLGFGFAEVGSVSARPAGGNPRPRAFRLPKDRALVNRMGLGNEGAACVAERLEKQLSRDEAALPYPLGINLAKTHDPQIMGAAAVDDFRLSFRRLAPLADYVTLNISCPNTRDGKTFEAPDALDALLEAIFAERAALELDVPVLIKLSPPPRAPADFDSGLDEIVALALARGVQGFVATNTASDRAGLSTPARRLEQIGRGGLSGRPLAARSTRLVRTLYRQAGSRVPIIGVGGVDSGAAAYEKIRAGASLVQLYTALVYEGPGVVRRINEDLVRRLDRDGFSSIREAVGTRAEAPPVQSR